MGIGWIVLIVIAAIVGLFFMCVFIWMAITSLRIKIDPEYINKQMRKADEQIKLNNEQIKLNNENIQIDIENLPFFQESRQLAGEAIRKSKVAAKILGELEQQMLQNLFSAVELVEITQDKQNVTDLTARATEAAWPLIDLLDENVKLQPFGAATQEISDAKAANIAEIRVAHEHMLACEAAMDAADAKIEQWVALGKTRRGR